MLAESEKDAIRRLARGENGARAECQPIYFANIKAHVDGGRKSVEMNFLSEVFNSCPDFALRSMYRKKLVIPE